jgi:hypothetical protein
VGHDQPADCGCGGRRVKLVVFRRIDIPILVFHSIPGSGGRDALDSRGERREAESAERKNGYLFLSALSATLRSLR